MYVRTAYDDTIVLKFQKIAFPSLDSHLFPRSRFGNMSYQRSLIHQFYIRNIEDIKLKEKQIDSFTSGHSCQELVIESLLMLQDVKRFKIKNIHPFTAGCFYVTN